jgi:hypothetical protein
MIGSLIESIRVKRGEQDYLLRVLELWVAAEAQGIDSSSGGSFGFDSWLLTPKQRIEWHRHRSRFEKRSMTGVSRPRLFNYFRYPNNQIVILTLYWRLCTVKVLLEACLEGCWCAIRIVHEYPNIRAALNSLPMFARQQKVHLDDVRLKALRTEAQLLAAENAVIAYFERMDDPRR